MGKEYNDEAKDRSAAKGSAKFDDTKYATRSLKKEQQPLKLRDLLKSIPIIGSFLVNIFTSKKEAYKKLQSQTSSSNEVKNETRVDDKHTEGVGSKLEKGNVEQIDNKKSRNP